MTINLSDPVEVAAMERALRKQAHCYHQMIDEELNVFWVFLGSYKSAFSLGAEYKAQLLEHNVPETPLT